MGNCATRKETVKKNKKHQPKPRVNPKKNTPLPVTPEETKKDKSFKKAKEDRKKDKSSKKDKEDRKKHQKLVEKDKSSNKEKNDRSEYPNLEDLEKHCDKSSQEPSFVTQSVTNDYEKLYTKGKVLDDVEQVWSASVILLIVIIMYLLEKLIS